jgi:hypothetical protein
MECLLRETNEENEEEKKKMKRKNGRGRMEKRGNAGSYSHVQTSICPMVNSEVAASIGESNVGHGREFPRPSDELIESAHSSPPSAIRSASARM